MENKKQRTIQRTKFVCLFEGRHEIPQNEGAIVESFDFEKFKAKKTEKWQEALEVLETNGTVYLYVTGLTPALTQFIAEAYKLRAVQDGMDIGLGGESPAVIKGDLILLHYDKGEDKYKAQEV